MIMDKNSNKLGYLLNIEITCLIIVFFSLCCVSCSHNSGKKNNSTATELSDVPDTPLVVPFEYKYMKIYLTSVIQNDSLKFILDNLGDYTFLPQKIAYNYCDSTRDKIWMINQNKHKSFLCKKHFTLQLGDYSYNIDTLQIILPERDPILKDPKFLELRGLIGTTFFYDKIVKIDFDRQQILLYKYLPPECKDYIVLSLTGSKNKVNDRKVQLTFKGVDKKPVTGEFLVDLGGLHSYMNPEVRDRIDMTAMSEDSTDFASVLLSRSFLIHKNIKAEFVNGQTGELKNLYEGHIGLIAMDILSQFNLIFDYNGRKLYLKPNHNYQNFDRKKSNPFKIYD